MYQAANLENSKIKTAFVFQRQTLPKQQIEEVVEPQTAFLAASVAEKSLAYAEAANFALFLVLIITAASLTAYGVMQIAQTLAELNSN